jgi:hypothetical protein
MQHPAGTTSRPPQIRPGSTMSAGADLCGREVVLWGCAWALWEIVGEGAWTVPTGVNKDTPGTDLPI